MNNAIRFFSIKIINLNEIENLSEENIILLKAFK